MKEQINKVIEYFKSKLFDLDFDIKNISANSLKLTIDDQYDFVLLYGIRYNYITVYESSFINIKLNQEEQDLLLQKLYPVIKMKITQDLIEKKQNELDELINELNNFE